MIAAIRRKPIHVFLSIRCTIILISIHSPLHFHSLLPATLSTPLCTITRSCLRYYPLLSVLSLTPLSDTIPSPLHHHSFLSVSISHSCLRYYSLPFALSLILICDTTCSYQRYYSLLFAQSLIPICSIPHSYLRYCSLLCARLFITIRIRNTIHCYLYSRYYPLRLTILSTATRLLFGMANLVAVICSVCLR